MLKISLLTKTLKGYLNESDVQPLTNTYLVSLMRVVTNVTKRLQSFIKERKQDRMGMDNRVGKLIYTYVPNKPSSFYCITVLKAKLSCCWVCG